MINLKSCFLLFGCDVPTINIHYKIITYTCDNKMNNFGILPVQYENY